MVLQTGIKEFLKMNQISDKVIKFIIEAMKNWKMLLTTGGKTFAKAKIQKGIFQGDAVLPLLFVIAMMSLCY